ncbi:Gem-associated protein [Parasponia andersonii]|uniref:Gem-associated protein n=1 Tax=Parasponia andersonii TaxID=3476 RepID=A0A2P5DNR9_PARAD|nr:Gem-associated protein [Parasponia andersonii]
MADTYSAVTEENTYQSSEIVSTLKQDEDSTMAKTPLILDTFLHSKKPNSEKDVVQNHDTTDSVTPNSPTADSLSGSLNSDQTVQDFPGNHEVCLDSHLGSLQESSFSGPIEKEDNDNKFLGCRLEVGKKHLLEEIKSYINAGDSVSTLGAGEMRNGFQDELKVSDSDHTRAYDSKFLGKGNELGCRLVVEKMHLLEEIRASVAAGDSKPTLETGETTRGIQDELKVIDSDHTQAYDNKFLGNDDELGCRLVVEKTRTLEEIEASVMAGDSTPSLETGEMRSGIQDELKVIGSGHTRAYDNKFSGNDDGLGRRLKVEVEALKMINGDSRCSLEIKVVDETALIGPVSVPKLRKKMDLVVPSKYTRSHGNMHKNGKEDIVEKVKSSQRTKRVFLKKGERSKMMYSRGAMKALRFVNIVQQRKMWKDVHTGLGPVVRKEYDYLVSSKNQKNFQFNFGKKDEPTSVLGMVAARGRSNHVNVFAH